MVFKTKAIEPRWVCFSCGPKYGTPYEGVCTVHQGICDICKQEKPVTSGRKFRPYKEQI